MPLLKEIGLVAASLEATAYTAETVDATDAVFNPYDIEVDVVATHFERFQAGSLSPKEGVIGERSGTVKFKTGLEGDGAAGIPTWASIFLPACGYADPVGGAQTYLPISNGIGANGTTATISVYEGGTTALVHKIHGAMGNFIFNAPTGQPAFIEWEFMGAYTSTTDATILAPNYPDPKPLITKGATFTLAAWSPCTESVVINAGNNVVLRKCATDATGIEGAMITGRRPTGTMNPEAALVATKDNYGLWLAGTAEALSFALTDGTDTITVAAPKAQRTNVTNSERDGIMVHNIEFQCCNSADIGNDELTITFA